MDKEFLESLGLEETAVTAILERHTQQEQAHAAALEQVRFDHLLEQAVAREGGRNAVAIRALLDVDALAAAEDRQKAVQDAVKKLKKDCNYLFESPVPPAYATGTGTNRGYVPEEPKSLAEALKEKFKKK